MLMDALEIALGLHVIRCVSQQKWSQCQQALKALTTTLAEEGIYQQTGLLCDTHHPDEVWIKKGEAVLMVTKVTILKKKQLLLQLNGTG